MPPVRGTQTIVDQMGWVFRRPVLPVLEIVWRWAVGVPFLLLAQGAQQRVVAALSPEDAGLHALDGQNPWIAVRQLDVIWGKYEPLVAAQLHWLAPLAIVAWIVLSGVGRAVVLKRIEPGARFKPVTLVVLQAVWVALLAVVLWLWWQVMAWVAVTHIQRPGEPDLVGYFMWLIFASLGFFTLWAVVSWPAAVAHVLAVQEGCGPLRALATSLRLGREFTSKLMEIGLVMGIVKLALIVLTMVFSAAPLPFSDQLGPEALHVVTMASLVFFFVASDYFHVVRLKTLVELWRTYRGSAS